MSWITAQLTPTPSEPQNAATILEITLHIYYDTPSCDHELIEVKTPTDLSSEGTSNCLMVHGVTMKYSQVNIITFGT